MKSVKDWGMDVAARSTAAGAVVGGAVGSVGPRMTYDGSPGALRDAVAKIAPHVTDFVAQHPYGAPLVAGGIAAAATAGLMAIHRRGRVVGYREADQHPALGQQFNNVK